MCFCLRQTGVENLDSVVGVYAPDAESYKVFDLLFDPIIEDYHGGFKKTDKHPPSDFLTGNLNQLVNVDPANKYVISTRISFSRSLEDYSFNSRLTGAQYKEIEAKIKAQLDTFEGELEGTYYPSSSIEKGKQQEFINSLRLPEEDYRFLEAAKAFRFWPTGRGIFLNRTTTFVMWVNDKCK